MSEYNGMMPATLDREISSAEQDAFGHRHFAKALRSIIESPQHAPPFSIGLLGGWGTGKSSIKELYTSELANDAEKQDSLRRKDRFHCITFNAWRFGGHDQDIKRALLRHVYLELGGTEENLHDKLFRYISETKQVNKSWLRYTCETLQAWAMPIPALLVSLLLLLTICYLTISFFKVDDSLLAGVIFACVTWAYTYCLKHIKPPAVSLADPITSIALPSTTSEQYENLLLEQIHRYKTGECKSLDKRSGKSCERLIVFVDDLDRLSAEEMVLGLDAVRTFMEIPKSRLPDGLGLVFVISCDEAKVADALARGRRNGDLPGTVFNHYDARRYLDRIFQFRLEIPPPPRNDMRSFATAHLSKLTSITEDLKSRGFQIAPLIDRMIHVGVQDPRNALQIVNAFAQAWWLARNREAEGPGTEKRGGLHEGAVTSHPISLGALCAMKVSFPDFYRDLQDDPALLQRFINVVVRGQNLSEQPLSTQQLLKERYLKVADESKPNEILLKPEHRPLRTFIASLDGLRWPSSLQSLLLLSEDPITRRLGAKFSLIFGDFVSGNTIGVLEGLGRHNDAAPLHTHEAYALHQMFEELRNELPERRARAARVIADLVDRIPEPPAQQLINILCREMADSISLRSQLGVEKIGKILDYALAADQQIIASRLVDDVLACGNPVAMLRETMETPSLDEAVKMVRSAIPLVLAVRSKHGLESTSDISFLAWLLDRSVTIGSRTTQLPFDELETWLADQDMSLVIGLGLDYVGALATELEKDDPAEFNVGDAVARVRKIFDYLMGKGEESREELWDPLARYVSLPEVVAVRNAWEVVVNNHRDANDDDLSHFVIAFVERININDDFDGGWKLDLEEAATPLLALVRERTSSLGDGAVEELAKLADKWTISPSLPSQACTLLKQLRVRDNSAFVGAITGWASRLLTNLPLDCVELIASEFAGLPKETQDAVTTSLAGVLAAEKIEDSVKQRYSTFTKLVPSNNWKANPLLGHLDNQLQQISARSNNSNGYLYSIIPATVHLFKHATPSILGASLQQLFAQAKGHPAFYSWLHSWMVNDWPTMSDQLTPYDPQVIFDDAYLFALEHPAESKQGLLDSMSELFELTDSIEANKSKLIAAACAIWSAHPKDTLETFRNGHSELSAEQIANLATTINWEDGDQINALRSAWKIMEGVADESCTLEATRLILHKGPLGTAQHADIAVQLWLESQSDSGSTLLKKSLVDPNLNDSHRRRLWAKATMRANELGPKFFITLAPKITETPSSEETATAMFDDFAIIDSVLGSVENRAEMARGLMNSFIRTNSNTIKARIAEASNRLAGKGALKSFIPESLTQDEYSILEAHFGKTSDVKRLNKLVSGG